MGIASSLGIAVGLSTPAQALPGQTVAEVAAWMRSNPTIRPGRNEQLIVRKSDSAAQRFSFESSLFAPGALVAGSRSGGRIRNETLKLFDMQNGVSKARLEEALRSIYGLDVTQDFDRAEPIYTYPTAATVATGISQNKPILSALHGEIRKGARFAYWVEVARTAEGKAYSGRITVFQHRDIDKLEAEVRNR
ncbi:hypothetical protein IQ266_15265 [filamentous cyanobacterium LEGE 11480]|uniref:Uncharacterized protein n=1 Tax=Romeriopsis navalis LEGE 11480 TaxID=2777977 RepID=A0A928VM14_9CYAN|nr:hypothetical protein [Romeriopsis navalis LEGE 11480]